MLPAFRTIRTAAMAMGLSLLTACSALTGLGEVSTPLDVFVLELPQDLPRRQGAPQSRAIIIEEPTTDGALATERIMIQPNALQAQYLPGVSWTDPAPIMLQTLMVRALDATGAFEYVGRRPLGPGGGLCNRHGTRRFSGGSPPRRGKRTDRHCDDLAARA